MPRKKLRKIYLDHASTTPVDQNVLALMLPYLQDRYGNPSSLHYEGRAARSAVEMSRKKIAEIIGAEEDEIIFTSGGTEADNLAILGLARANQDNGKHIIVSGIEHKAILDACKKLEKEGFEITYLDVDKSGLVSLNHLKSSLRADTILVSVMYANNEIGSIQKIKKISEIIKESKICRPIFHTDACQAAGALPINTQELGVDAITISGSKIYGPKGSGCLYVNKKYGIEPIAAGGGQERGFRSGTENVAGIVGLAKALSISENKRVAEGKRLTGLRDYFLAEILKIIDGVTVNGGKKNRLPNNINISIKGVEGESLLLYLDEKGIFVSTGSACSSADLNPSHVLLKIGTPLAMAHCSIRFTLGRRTKRGDIDYTVKVLREGVEKLRKISSI